MKNYISQVSDEEIAGWIVDYMEEVGFSKSEGLLNPESCDEIFIERGKGNAIITACFEHPQRSYNGQESISYFSNALEAYMHEPISVVFYGDSYNMEVLDVYESNVAKFAFEESTSVAEDLKRYWQSKMYWKFKDEGYLDNLNKYEEKLQQEMEEHADASDMGL